MVAFLVVLLPALMVPVTSQNLKAALPRMVNGDSNEDAKAELDLLAQSVNQDQAIILISRLGRNKFSQHLARRRLRTASLYLVMTRGLQKERIVAAIGDRINDIGRIEVYIDSRLFMIFTFARNKDFAPES